MYVEHPHFRPPEDLNTSIWRYMSFLQFVWMIATQKLFFVRVDQLEDPWEGSAIPQGWREKWDVSAVEDLLVLESLM
jgi:hypothetical protein